MVTSSLRSTLIHMAVLEAPERHQDLIEELIAEVADYNSDVDRDLLARAFRYAAKAHEGQQRRSGEAFIHHPYAVARICAEVQRRYWSPPVMARAKWR